MINAISYKCMYQTDVTGHSESATTLLEFKRGRCSDSVKSWILSNIREIIYENVGKWVVCFIPTSLDTDVYERYGSLAIFLSRELDTEVNLKILTVGSNEYSAPLKRLPLDCVSCNEDAVKGKSVILIDDFIQSGKTFHTIANLLREKGAVTIIGLIIARKD